MGTFQADVNTFISTMKARLNNSVVGYTGVVGGVGIPTTKFSGGSARTSADGTVVPFTSSTMSGVGSVSKFITAIGAVQLLDLPDTVGVQGMNVLGLNLDSAMYKALPAYWDLRKDIQDITFRDLLTHRSGLAAEGATGEPGMDYFSLKTYMSPNPAPGTPPLGPIGQQAYSNVGFALFRLLLPNIAGLVPTAPPASEQERANQYAVAFQQILNDNIWSRLGVTGPSLGTPQDNTHAFSYFYPGGTPGFDWSQWKYPGQVWPGEGQPLVAGAGTCWLSIDQLTTLLASINTGDERVLTSLQWDHMQAYNVPVGAEGYGLGLDTLTIKVNGIDVEWRGKNGDISGSTGTQGGLFTAGMAFGGSTSSEGPLFAALITNSDVTRGPGWNDTWFYCKKCNTLYTSLPGGNVCPADGKGHNSGGQYELSVYAQTDGQSNWRQCSKCAALCYEQPGTTGPSKCPADHGHHAPSGSTFVLSQTGQATSEIQADWRLCKNCGVLAYSNGNASAGHCAAGGPHQFNLGVNSYAIQQVIAADTVMIEGYTASLS